LLNPYIGTFRTELVFQARSICQPLTLGIIAQFLKKAKFDFTFLDGNALDLGPQAVLKLVKDIEPTVIVTTTTHDIDYEQPRLSLKDISDIAAGLDPLISLIVMGTHGTVWPMKTMDEIPNVSVLVRGEPELTAWETILALNDGECLDSVPGISFRDNNGSICHNPDRPFIEDLDSLPLPAYELMPMDRYVSPYRNTMSKSAAIITSRGCPNGCYFCCTHLMGGRKLRVKSIARVMEEISLLVKDYGVQFIHFIDDTFNLDYDRVRSLCIEMIKRDLSFGWNAQMVLPRNDEQERRFVELIPLMKESGCTGASIGLEAVPEATRQYIPKSDPARFVRIHHAAKENGLPVYPNNMFGLRGETMKTLQEQDEFFTLYGGVKRFHRSVVIPRPGTKLYDIALRKDQVCPEDSWEKIAEIAGQVGNELTRRDLLENIAYMDELERDYKEKHGMKSRKV